MSLIHREDRAAGENKVGVMGVVRHQCSPEMFGGDLITRSEANG